MQQDADAALSEESKLREELAGGGIVQLFISAPTELHRLQGTPISQWSPSPESPRTFPRLVETVVGVATFQRTPEEDAPRFRVIQHAGAGKNPTRKTWQ